MFTGIIESTGTVVSLQRQGANLHLGIASAIGGELKPDQSVSHNGVCLTVTRVMGQTHWVTAVDETLRRSTLGVFTEGTVVNLERSMPAAGRFDGHIVQGHVDQQGTCTAIREANGSRLYDFTYDPSAGNITVEKGSICVNGVSLTCFNSRPGAFTVTIIPYTYDHTNFYALKAGDAVNLEFDIVGKYIQRLMKGYAGQSL